MVHLSPGRYVPAGLLLVLEAPLLAVLAFGALVTRPLVVLARWTERQRQRALAR